MRFMTKALLTEHLIQGHRFERGDQLQGLPGREAAHTIEDRAHGRLLRLDQWTDVEVERRERVSIHDASLREHAAIALIRIKPTTIFVV